MGILRGVNWFSEQKLRHDRTSSEVTSVLLKNLYSETSRILELSSNAPTEHMLLRDVTAM